MLDCVWDRGDATGARAARRGVRNDSASYVSSAVRAAALVIAAALAAPAAAQAGNPRIGGFLPVDAAKRFQKRYFPPEAPKLLRDKRATFFHTKQPIWV